MAVQRIPVGRASFVESWKVFNYFSSLCIYEYERLGTDRACAFRIVINIWKHASCTPGLHQGAHIHMFLYLLIDTYYTYSIHVLLYSSTFFLHYVSMFLDLLIDTKCIIVLFNYFSSLRVYVS